jgi:hypothetical protein
MALAGGVAVLAAWIGWNVGRHVEVQRTPGRVSLADRSPAALQPVQQAAHPAPMLPSPSVRHAIDTSTVEVCGYGAVQIPPDDPDPVQRIPPVLRQSAIDAADALMLASDDAQVRAAALWMGARIRGREVRERVEQMARLAVASQDPYVYAMAIEACHGLGAAELGSCRLLSRAQWVRLDPDNAVPWQALAAEARERDEPQAADAALQLAARARHSDVHAGWLPHLVDKALGTQAAPLQRTLALSASWSAEAVWAASHGQRVGSSSGAWAQGFDLSCDSVNRMQRGISRPERALALGSSPGQKR